MRFRKGYITFPLPAARSRLIALPIKHLTTAVVMSEDRTLLVSAKRLSVMLSTGCLNKDVVKKGPQFHPNSHQMSH